MAVWFHENFEQIMGTALGIFLWFLVVDAFWKSGVQKRLDKLERD
jgi:hypothetical protein